MVFSSKTFFCLNRRPCSRFVCFLAEWTTMSYYLSNTSCQTVCLAIRFAFFADAPRWTVWTRIELCELIFQNKRERAHCERTSKRSCHTLMYITNCCRQNGSCREILVQSIIMAAHYLSLSLSPKSGPAFRSPICITDCFICLFADKLKFEHSDIFDRFHILFIWRPFISLRRPILPNLMWPFERLTFGNDARRTVSCACCAPSAPNGAHSSLMNHYLSLPESRALIRERERERESQFEAIRIAFRARQVLRV